MRRRLYGGVNGRDWLTYFWQMMPELRRLRPKLIICYDSFFLGPALRKARCAIGIVKAKDRCLGEAVGSAVAVGVQRVALDFCRAAIVGFND